MSLTLPLDDYEYIEDDAFKSASPLLRSPHLDGVTLLQTSQNSPGSLDEDVVALSFLSEPDDFSKYKSKLTTLYTNEPLQIVQRGIISLFSRKPLEGQTLISLNGVIKSVLKQDIGEFIVPFYEERILKKAMWKLRDEVIEDEGETLLDNLSHTWNHFYKELLPALQVIFCGVLPRTTVWYLFPHGHGSEVNRICPHPSPSIGHYLILRHTAYQTLFPTYEMVYKNLSIRERTLIAFRDEMLLKTQIRGSILLLSRLKQRKERASSQYTTTSRRSADEEDTVSSLEQMFLVLLSVWTPSAKQYIELETLAAQLISPLMTARGVYYNGKVTPAPQPKNLKKAKSSGNLRLDELSADRATLTLPRMLTPKHSRQRSQPVVFIKELFSPSSVSSSEGRLLSGSYSRARAQSQSDIL